MSPSLQPDPLVAQLRPDPADFQDLVALDGYLGDPTGDIQRLYHDLSLSFWVEIDQDDLVHKETVSVPGAPDASVVWVKRGAQLTMVESPEESRSRVPAVQITPEDLLTEGEPPLWT